MSATRKPFVGGNWKANGNTKSNAALIQVLNSAPVDQFDASKVDVIVAPSTIHITSVQAQLRNDIGVSAQNCYMDSGAFTGETSVDMLCDLSLRHVILGHSERRHVFGESDALIAQKTLRALKSGLTVILCIGEKLNEREEGKTEEVLTQQLSVPSQQLLSDHSQLWKNVVVAYEPVWAIGTGKTASPQQAQDAHAFIRSWLAKNVSEQVAQETRIIYGGSVKASNSDELFKCEDIDGFLVGGASLNAEFLSIIASCQKN